MYRLPIGTRIAPAPPAESTFATESQPVQDAGLRVSDLNAFVPSRLARCYVRVSE
jgi:hypothetical protein